MSTHNINSDLIVIGTETITSLAGSGTRMVTTDASGKLIASPLTSGTVTNIVLGQGLTGTSPLTSTGTISLGTPSTITLSSSNSTTTNSHTHAFLPGGNANQYIDGTGSLQTSPDLSIFELISNKINDLGSNLDATHYPSTKAIDEWGFINRGSFSGSAIDIDTTTKMGMYGINGGSTPGGTLPSNYNTSIRGTLLVYSRPPGSNYVWEYQILTQTDGSAWSRHSDVNGNWSVWKQYADRDWAEGNFVSLNPNSDNSQSANYIGNLNDLIGINQFNFNGNNAINKPPFFPYGGVLYNHAITTNLGTQMALGWSASSGDDYFGYRSKNSGVWSDWYRVASRDWVLTQIPDPQTLSLSGNNLSISGGNTVTLPTSSDTNIGNSNLTIPASTSRTLDTGTTSSLSIGNISGGKGLSIQPNSFASIGYPISMLLSGTDLSNSTSAVGYNTTSTFMIGPSVVLGNDIANKQGEFIFGNNTAPRHYTWQNKDGIVALLDDIPTDYVPTSRTITAGNGLTGGGNLSANRTITMGTPGAITLSSTNSVTTSSHTHSFSPGGTASQYIRGNGTLAAFPIIPDLYISNDPTNTLNPQQTNDFPTITSYDDVEQSIVYANSGLTNGPAMNGALLTVYNKNTKSYGGQFVIGYDGSGYIRGKSNNSWGGWKSLAFTDDIPLVNNSTITLSAGTGLNGGGSFTLNQSTNSTITFNHAAHTGDVTGSTTLTIANNAVTFPKIVNIPTQTLMGRYSSGTGNVQSITLGTGLTLNGSGVLSATNTSSGTVTSVAAGNGMNFSTITGSGNVTLGTPGAITLSSTNSVTANSHTHAFNPGGTTSQYIRGNGTLATFPNIPSDYIANTSPSGNWDNANTDGNSKLVTSSTGSPTGGNTNGIFIAHGGQGTQYGTEISGRLNRLFWRSLESGTWNTWKEVASLTDIPTVNNGTLTLNTSGIATGTGTFSANQSNNSSVTVNVPGTDLGGNFNSSTGVLTITSSTGSNASITIGGTGGNINDGYDYGTYDNTTWNGWNTRGGLATKIYEHTNPINYTVVEDDHTVVFDNIPAAITCFLPNPLYSSPGRELILTNYGADTSDISVRGVYRGGLSVHTLPSRTTWHLQSTGQYWYVLSTSDAPVF